MLCQKFYDLFDNIGCKFEGFHFIRKNIFTSLFSVHNNNKFTRREQVCLMRLRFEGLFLLLSNSVTFLLFG